MGIWVSVSGFRFSILVGLVGLLYKYGLGKVHIALKTTPRAWMGSFMLFYALRGFFSLFPYSSQCQC